MWLTGTNGNNVVHNGVVFEEKVSPTNDRQPVFLRMYFCLCGFIVCMLVLGTYWSCNDTSKVVSQFFMQRMVDVQCPDVLNGISQGMWITRPLSKSEEKQIHAFLITARSHYGVSATMQRSDNRCGSVGFPGLKSHPALKFRALCDPLGRTPCCENFQCVNKSVERCSCLGCFDVRQQIHAEYALWKPTDGRCSFKNYTALTACELLAGSKLYFIGDSYLRQMYAMMVMHLTNNYQNSTLLPQTPPAGRKRYHGPYQLLCYKFLNRIKSVCNQTLLAHYEIITPNQVKFVQGLVNSLRNTSRSVILLGQGIHSAYDRQSTWNHFLLPILELYNRTKQIWPKLVWVSPHAHGIMKLPRNSQQRDENLRLFNEFINGKLREWNVAVFDTFPMTQGVMAYDGAHYGTGVNMAKIQVIYNHIHDLTNKGLW